MAAAAAVAWLIMFLANFHRRKTRCVAELGELILRLQTFRRNGSVIFGYDCDNACISQHHNPSFNKWSCFGVSVLLADTLTA